MFRTAAGWLASGWPYIFLIWFSSLNFFLLFRSGFLDIYYWFDLLIDRLINDAASHLNNPALLIFNLVWFGCLDHVPHSIINQKRKMKVSAFKMKLTKKYIKNTFWSVICHTVLLLIWVKNNDEKSFQKNKFPKKFLSLFFNHNQKKQFSGKPLPLLQLFIICVFFLHFIV